MVMINIRLPKDKKMSKKMIFGFLFAIFLLTACAQPPSGGVSTPTIAPVIPANPTPTQAVEITPTSSSLTAAQSAAIQAASLKYGIPADQFKVVSTEAVTWPNGCLGVVIPGVMCTDALVDGYRIILEANGEQFEFHTNLDGTNVVDAAQLQATLNFVVRSQDGSFQLTNPNIPLGPTYNPAFNGFLPVGGSIAGTGYIIDLNQSKALAIDSNGTRDLSFIQNPNYGLAIWPGGEGASPMLAWGTQLLNGTQPSTLQVSAPDGSNLETLLTLDAGATPPQELVAEAWSADGQSLYFSKEPVGIGGYISFSGASNLFQINIATKEVKEIIPVSADSGPQICLDAMSGDYRYVADHCTQGVITIRDLQSGGTVTIEPPTDITDYRQMGSARFSPDGSKVAFALAKGNPDAEQGWVAVGDSAGGGSKTILVGNVGSFYMVAGWLDDQTVLVQSYSVACATCTNEIFTVTLDGASPTKVADGTFQTVIDNR